MTDRAATVAEALAAHQWSPSRGECWCGYQPAVGPLALSSMEDQFFAHQAAAVLAALDAAPAAPLTEGDLPDVEVIGADAGHWAAMENSGPDDLVCECGLPWARGEGCAYVQGARATVEAILAALDTDEATP